MFNDTTNKFINFTYVCIIIHTSYIKTHLFASTFVLVACTL